MGRKSKEQKVFEEGFAENLVNLIRLTTLTNEEAEEKYKLYIKNENLSPYQKKYFKSLMFDKIDYSDTWKKNATYIEEGYKSCDLFR